MINMIQNAKDQVLELTQRAYQAAVSAGQLPGDVSVRAGVEIPKDAANGDYTTTFALAAAKAMHKSPREIAGILLEHMDLGGSYFASAEIAGAGFLNFRLNPSWYAGVLSAVEGEGERYGRSDALKGRKIMVEFVSANPGLAGVLRQRRGQPDREIRQFPGGAVSPDHPGRGRGGLPRGRLPRR